jgi:hypothetical protein
LQGLPSKTMTMPLRIWVAEIAIRKSDSECFWIDLSLPPKGRARATENATEPFGNLVV